LAARGIGVGLEEAASLSKAFLILAEQGLLVPAERPGAKAAEGVRSVPPLDQEVGLET
jgi:hypothetical protein